MSTIFMNLGAAMATLKKMNSSARIMNKIWNIVSSSAIAIVIFQILRWCIKFMRNSDAPEELLLKMYSFFGMNSALLKLTNDGLSPLSAKISTAIIAIFVGVVGSWMFYWVFNELADNFSGNFKDKLLQPVVFLGPAIILLSVFLIYPTINTIYTSVTEDILRFPEEVSESYLSSNNILEGMILSGENIKLDKYIINNDDFEFVKIIVTNPKDELDTRNVYLLLFDGKITTFGMLNYKFAFTSPEMRIAFKNNLMWLVIGTSGSVGIGLLIATLVDKIKREALAKTFIFMPLAISAVGASVVWKFVFAWQPPGREQIGLLNYVMGLFGNEPVTWMLQIPQNTYALIVIMIWLQTGFCMVVLSAALKGVSNEIIEAARIDGAREAQIFFRVIIPIIKGSIITVATTVFISILKVFDIVYVMTSGKFETEVVANRMFVEMFSFRNFGRASSLAVVLLIVVIPIMFINVRNLRNQGVNQ